jgi:ribosome-binding ATPase YchF (GTP1/OBG family)
MSLEIGIVGLPNVGKSTLFNALTKNEVPAENYPFCTIDPCVGVVPVPDERLDVLSKLSETEKTIPAVVQFTDIAGLVKGAAKGEGLGNKFLSNIREVDAIGHMVRIFEDDGITHVHGKVDPVSDIEVINYELIMADAETVANRIASIGSDVKRGDKEAVKENNLLVKIEEVLKLGKLANKLDLNDDEKKILKGLHLLTAKPMMYILNKSIDTETPADLIEYFREHGSLYVVVDSVMEEGFDELIKKSYEVLGLITFLTTGKAETRAWTTKLNATAPEAGASIHSDFQHRFIRAEVVAYHDLVEHGSMSATRDKGLVRTEGKEYVVKDGDVIEFRV